MSKYSNRKVKFDIDEYTTVRFDSVVEKDRYVFLSGCEKRGLIHELELQPKFVLVDKFTRADKTYRELKYIADFKYIENGSVVIEDVKGYPTPEYLLKRKIFLAQNTDLRFKEVKRIRKQWEITEL